MNKITFLSVALLTFCLLLQSCGKDEPVERRGTSIIEVIVRNPQGEPQADKTVKVFNASDYETFKNNPQTKALLESRTDKEGKARFTLDAEEWFKGSRSAQDLYVVVEENYDVRNYRWWSQLVTVRPGRRRIVRMETGDEAEHISPDSPTRHKYLLISDGVVTGLRDSSVTHLVFPAEVRSIADGAFRDSRIESVVLNEGLESIGTQAFAGSRQLSAVTLPSSLKTIGSHAFEDCIALTGIDLSATALRRIEDETFRESGLKVATLPQALESIGAQAFMATRLESASLPPALRSVEDGAFREIATLRTVTLPDGIQQIGSYAFYRCTRLITVKSHGTATTYDGIIHEAAFSDCTALQHIALPQSLASLKGWTFSGCEQLKEITLPAHVKEIGDYALRTGFALATLRFEGKEPPTLGNNALPFLDQLSALIVPQGRTEAYRTRWEAYPSYHNKIKEEG